jgi:hypothetical protein
MNPGISSRAHWATIEAQVRSLAPSTIRLGCDPEARRFSGTTENVARLALDVAHALPQGKAPIELELDGQSFRAVPWPAGSGSHQIWLTRTESSWTLSPVAPSPALKGPHRHGPFKDALRHRFLLVYATKGSAEENAWSLARARYDAEVFWYRGNGSVDCWSDTDFLDPAHQAELHDRSVILYGHSQSNAAWPALLAKSPVQVERGKVRVGPRTLEGNDLACLFLRPHPGSDVACVGVVAGTGMPGLRLTERLPYFVSGVAYPDCTVFSAHDLAHPADAISAAGYFGPDWSLETGEFLWKSPPG